MINRIRDKINEIETDVAKFIKEISKSLET